MDETGGARSYRTWLIRPALDLKPIPMEKEVEFRKEFLFEKEPEVFTRGHLVNTGDAVSFDQKRVKKMAERALFSNYEDLLPTKRNFPAMVRTTAYVLCFINKCLRNVNRRKGTNKKWIGHLLAEATIWFSAFPAGPLIDKPDTKKMQLWVHLEEGSQRKQTVDLVISFSTGMNLASTQPFYKSHSSQDGLNDTHLNAALLYYFRQASQEVIEFNSRQVVEKIKFVIGL